MASMHEHRTTIIHIVTRYKCRGGSVVRDSDPRGFAMVMATGIVSVALRLPLIRQTGTAAVWVAAAAWAVVLGGMVASPAGKR